MDELKEIMINDILESKKIHALISSLHHYKANVFIVNNDDITNSIFEIIARRNLHVHKKGIIDQFYLGQTCGNPYNFSIGEYAHINMNYFNNSYEILRSMIDNFIK